MSKTIVLLRHAEAELPRSGQHDIERCLSSSGHQQMKQVGPDLAMRLPSSTLILASTANRTVETARLLVQAVGVDSDAVVLDERMYDASTGTLLQVLHALEPHTSSVVLVAHNPGVSTLAQTIVIRRESGIATAGYVVCRFDGDWPELAPKSAELIASNG